jgi:hypothetical protein
MAALHRRMNTRPFIARQYFHLAEFSRLASPDEPDDHLHIEAPSTRDTIFAYMITGSLPKGLKAM